MIGFSGATSATATATYFRVVGKWIAPEALSVHATFTPTLNRRYFIPLWLPGQSVAVDQVRCNVNAAGGAGALLRLELFNADATTGLPTGAATWDSGTIDANTTGWKSAALPAGTTISGTPRWVGLTCNIAVATNQLLGYSSALGDARFPIDDAEIAFARSQNSVLTAGVAAASTAGSVGVPHINLRMA